MPFTKGMQKSGGRSKNQPNKISNDIRLASAMLLEGQIDALAELLPKLKPAEYIKALQMLFKVAVPQQKQIETETINHPTNFQVEIIDRLSQVSDSDIEDAIQKSIKE